MTLYLSNLTNWEWLAQVDNGPMFWLGYYDVQDWADANNIERIQCLDTNEIDD